MSLLEDYRAIREGTAIGALSPRAQLAVSGRDRATYLQGLLTNDIQALTAGMGCYAAWLTPQGRMLTDMHVLESGSMILLDLPVATAAATLERLDQFIFSEDVTVAMLTGSLTGVWVHGPGAAGVVESMLRSGGPSGPSPSDAASVPFRSGGASASAEATADHRSPGRRWSAPPTDESGLGAWKDYQHARMEFEGEAVSVARIDQLGAPGFCLYVDRAREAQLVAALEAGGARSVGAAALEAARIEAGYPLYGIDMNETTIPLEAGIEQRAISFTKGCYVGQEIVIRVLHRGGGRVAKKLVSMRIVGPQPAAGAALFGGGKEIGHVTSAAVSPVLGSIALGYVHRDFVAPGTAVEVALDAGRAPAVVGERPLSPSPG